MTHTSNILFRAFALLALLSIAFNPLASRSGHDQQNILPIPELGSTEQADPAVPVLPSKGNSSIEQAAAATTIYLPIVMDNFYSYNGTVTNNGIPVANQVVDLRFYDGTDWSTYDTQVTNTSGAYYFTNLPVLAAGQAFYVRWMNNLANSNYLSAYYCDQIDLDNLGYSLMNCDFNIHNFYHVSPANASSIQLPKKFEWTMRPTTSDSYELDISDTVNDLPWFWTDPPLGYTNSYQLTSLPSGFQINVEYQWFMGVWGANGLGYTYYVRTITFENTGAVVLGPEKPVDPLALTERKEREMILPVGRPRQ